MIPCLYDATETEYRTNGIGKLADCTSCTVTEVRNSSYELKLTCPVDGIHAESLVEDNIILAKPADNRPSQPFRIYKVTKSMDGTIEVDARHISYQLNDITVSPTTVVTGTYDQVNAAFAGLKANASTDCPFDFETDMTSDAYFGILEPVSFRCALGGVDGSMLDTFGGEFEWDFYTVRLWKSRGSDNGVRIVYGKNLADFKQEKNIESVITGVHPYWKDEETGDITELPEKVVTLEDSDSPYERIGLLDCSSEFEEEPTWDQLRSAAQSYLKSTTTTEPNIDIDIDFAQLWQTPGYEDIVEAERVSLCDTVHVYITRLGVEVSTTVTETVYDVLLEKYRSITLSNSPTSARNSSFVLTVATTSQVKSMIAMTDTNIRLSVSSKYATKATLENNYSTTVEIQAMIDLSLEGITLAFEKKLSDEYSTTEEILAMIKLSEEGILLEFDKYSTTEEVQAMIRLSEEGITLSFEKILEDYSTTSQVQSMIQASEEGITLSFEKTLEETLEDYSTTSQVQALIQASEEGITLSFEKTLGDYSTTSQVQALIKASEDGIALTYTKNGEVRSQFAMENDSITISSGTITFNAGSLVIKSTPLNLDASGNLSISTNQFTLTTAGKAAFSGTLSAPDGNIGGWTIGTSSLYNGTDSLSSTTNGIYLGTNGIRSYSGGDYLNITSGYVENGDSSGSYARLYTGALRLAYQGTLMGAYSTNYWLNDSSKRGLSINLEYAADYIAFGRKSSTSATSYTSAYVINWNIGSSAITDYTERHIFYDSARFASSIAVVGAITTESSITASGTVYAGDGSTNSSARQIGAQTSSASVRLSVNSGSNPNLGLVDGVKNTFFAYWDATNSRYVFGNGDYPTRIAGSSVSGVNAIATVSALSADAVSPLAATNFRDPGHGMLANLTPRAYEVDGRKHVGLTVSELEESMRAVGMDPDDYDITERWEEDGEEVGAIRYDELIPLLISEIQTLNDRVEALEKEAAT